MGTKAGFQLGNFFIISERACQHADRGILIFRRPFYDT